MKNIPKILHLTWTFNSPMAKLNVFTILSFHRQNPDWKIIVHYMVQNYNDLGKNVYVPEYTGKDYFYMIEELDYVEIRKVDLVQLGIGTDKHAILSGDILRRYVLYEHGGVYSDFDVLWLRPMEDLSKVEHIGDIDNFEEMICLSQYKSGYHNVSILISEPKSNYNKYIIDEGKKLRPPFGHQDFGTDLLNRLFPTFSSIVEQYPRSLFLKYDTFFPYGIYFMENLWTKNNLQCLKDKNVIGIHWFNGHRLSKEYLNKDNFETVCSMTTILRKQKLI